MMEKTENSDKAVRSEKASLRRYEDDLYVSGTGVIVMGAWSVVKAGMELFLGAELKKDLVTDDTIPMALAMFLVFLIFAVISFVILKLHFYVGLNAVRAAKGQEHKKGYYKAAIIMLVLTLLNMGSYPEMFKDLGNIDTNLASVFVDLTTAYIFVIVLISTNKIKNLREQQSREPG